MAKRESVPANGKRRLEERLAKLTKGSNFPAYVRDNFDWLSQQVQKAGRNPEKWGEIAAWAVEEGITGGKPLTAAAAKKAYDREAARRKKSGDAATAKRKAQAQPATIPLPIRVADEPQSTNTTQQTSGDDAVARLRREMARRSGRDV